MRRAQIFRSVVVTLAGFAVLALMALAADNRSTDNRNTATAHRTPTRTRSMTDAAPLTPGDPKNEATFTTRSSADPGLAQPVIYLHQAAEQAKCVLYTEFWVCGFRGIISDPGDRRPK
jgi:hypothetical protein